MSQSHTIAGSFYKSGNISHYKGFFLAYLNYPKNRSEGSKMIIGNFRFRCAYRRYKSRFSYIWKPYKSHICYKFKLQSYFKFLSRVTRLCKSRNLSGRSGKITVSPASSSTMSKYLRFVRRNIRHNTSGLSVLYHCSSGNLDY